MSIRIPNQFVSRKYLLTIAVIACATVALFMRIMDGNAYAAVLVACQGFYQGANAFDSRTDVMFSQQQGPQPPPQV
jgi:hypothetical protein